MMGGSGGELLRWPGGRKSSKGGMEDGDGWVPLMEMEVRCERLFAVNGHFASKEKNEKEKK